MLSSPMRISVVVPAFDAAASLAECVARLRAAADPETEIIVVDDASHDESAAVAARAGAHVLRLPENAGPSVARNAGARHAAGDLLVFVDADVAVAPDTLRRLATVVAARPDVAAVFGSYDAAPRAPGLVSQFRNLLHHFVHQHGAREASTFWAGCGAIRRSAFAAVGGFDEGRWARTVEDIELGYRLRAAGHRIVLDPSIQVTHLKRWTLVSMLRTDALMRAVPWSRLLLERRPPLDHLNLGVGQRLSVASALLGAGGVLLVPLRPAAAAIPLLAALAVATLNAPLLRFLARTRGAAFALAALPLLLLHYLEGGLCWTYAWLEHHAARLGSRRRPPPAA